MSRNSSRPSGRNLGQGVRQLRLSDTLPNCEIRINRRAYDLGELAPGSLVVDVGCGHGRFQSQVEDVGGTWIGIEPFEGGAHSVRSVSNHLPFRSNSVDIVIMHAVLEHVPDVVGTFDEVQRVLVPGGLFVGYAAFMECFHEISYNHLSHKALELHAVRCGLSLEVISGGGAFGIDYHVARLLYPIPTRLVRRLIQFLVRSVMRSRATLAYLALRLVRSETHITSATRARDFFHLECLGQSAGLSFVMRKPT